jgi:Tfp pilus assembly protein PilF
MNKINRINEMLLENPTDSFLQHALALEYIKLNKDEIAKKLFETILEREPGYVGSYYHLAKLLERLNDNEGAIKVYEKGMAESKRLGDNHAFGELRSAYEELIY